MSDVRDDIERAMGSSAIGSVVGGALGGIAGNRLGRGLRAKAKVHSDLAKHFKQGGNRQLARDQYGVAGGYRQRSAMRTAGGAATGALTGGALGGLAQQHRKK